MNTLYLAIELSAKTWKLGWSYPTHRKVKIIDVEARDWVAFDAAVEQAKTFFELADVEIVSCYEAGRDCFWIDRGLAERGIKNLVIDSASIEVNRQKRRAKTDRLDVKSLLGLLKRHHKEDDEHAFRLGSRRASGIAGRYLKTVRGHWSGSEVLLPAPRGTVLESLPQPQGNV